MANREQHTQRIKLALEKMTSKLTGRLEGSYQHNGVRWMLYRELECSIKGGILADDMGLGKTIQAIGLIRANPCPTLIICPVSLVGQWRDELISFGAFRPIVLNSSYKGILPKDIEVVLTSYSSFQGKNPPKCLTKTEWGRIILDEGHIIRNHKTRLNKEITKVQATRKWLLTGTPINNSNKDLRTLVTWIGGDASKSRNSTDICKEYVLRRTQEGEAAINPRMALPNLDTVVKRLVFKYPEEQELYDNVEVYFQKQLESVSTSRRHMAAIEGGIRLRQVCIGSH